MKKVTVIFDSNASTKQINDTLNSLMGKLNEVTEPGQVEWIIKKKV